MHCERSEPVELDVLITKNKRCLKIEHFFIFKSKIGGYS